MTKLSEIIDRRGEECGMENILIRKPKDLEQAILSWIKEEGDKLIEEHSKDCVYVIEPRYFGNPSKEKYCTCGTFNNNYAIQQFKKALEVE